MAFALSSCSNAADQTENKPLLRDGVYSAKFTTDGSMFHVNEAYKGRGRLTVKDGTMTIHSTMPSKNTVNLFAGKAEDAQKNGALLIAPTVDTVTYEDGMQEEVFGFDLPVPYIGEEFDCALVGTKGKWYDHKVSVDDPVRIIEDGEYTVNVTLSGGAGKASVDSPAKLIAENGVYTAELVWSSPNYEYVVVDGVQYDRLDREGNSAFLIPVRIDEEIRISALTTAMSTPHLIEYTLFFDGETIE